MIPARDSGPTGTDIALSTVSMAVLALAQPLLDLLGRNPEFFLARAAPTLDVVMLGLALGLVLPLVLAGLVTGVYSWNATTGRLLHSGILIVLGALLVVAILKRTPIAGVQWWLDVGVSLVVGMAIAVAFTRSPWVRTGFRYIAIAPVVVIAVFLFLAPTSKLVIGTDSVAGSFSPTVGDPAPLVMVVFDELPLASIIDREGNLQQDLFPNFARLAEDGTWFRNAVGVHQRTQEALPTIVSGISAPLEGKVPSAADYPYTIFSLLDAAYEVNVVETVTELCSDAACRGGSRTPVPLYVRWRALISDLVVVAGRVLLPEALNDWLPPVDQNWGDFGAIGSEPEGASWSMRERIGDLLDADRRTDVTRFLSEIDGPLGDGEFYFGHLMFPHWPWIHLPDGRLYSVPGPPVPGHGEDGWTSDEWLVEQAYQRHLLQVQYADSIVGEVIERLIATESYDDAMLVVLADHGGTIRPDVEERRWILPDTVGDVAAIPLFIKRPHADRTGIDDYRAETVDIVPTIADVLEVTIPWRVDGVSLFSEERPERETSTMMATQGSVTFGVSGDEKLEVARYHLGFFGDGGVFELAPAGHADLLGDSTTSLPSGEISDHDVILDNPEWYSDVEPTGDFVPARLTGVVTGESTGPLVLAIGLNGRIEAVTRTWKDGERIRFQAMIPPDSFIPGDNDITVFQVQEIAGRRSLALLSRGP